MGFHSRATTLKVAATMVAVSVAVLAGSAPRGLGSSLPTQESTGGTSWIVSLRTVERLSKLDRGLAEQVFDTPQTLIVLPHPLLRQDDAALSLFTRAIPTVRFTDERKLAQFVEQSRRPAGARAVLYGSEDSPLTPRAQQLDPRLFYRLAGQLAHQHHLLFVAAPGIDLVDRMAPGIPRRLRPAAFLALGIPADAARYADVYDVQAQNLEASAPQYARFVRRAAALARRANAGVEVVAGLSTTLLGRRQPTSVLLRAARDTAATVQGYSLHDPGCGGCAAHPGVAIAFLKALTPSPPPGCTPTAILVNPCAPWLGAAASGNPGTPMQIAAGDGPGSDPLSQFNYLSQLTGQHLQVFRDYHSPLNAGNSNATLPFDPATAVGKAELEFAAAGVYDDVNWSPSTFQQAMPVAQGGDPAVNADIKLVADRIKQLAPRKIFLTLWHETNINISSDPNPPTGCTPQLAKNPNRQFGSPAQFVAAWRNIYDVFAQEGATNVVWAIDYLQGTTHECVVPQLWPGNQYVDWVLFDSYPGTQGRSWQDSAGLFYTYLTQHSSAVINYASKPWGIGEFGYCNVHPGGLTAEQYFGSVQAAVQANTYPKLKMYLVYADTGGPNPANDAGCLTDYSTDPTTGSRVYDPAKQQSFNTLASAIAAKVPPSPAANYRAPANTGASDKPHRVARRVH
jgi:hypothetical protein